MYLEGVNYQYLVLLSFFILAYSLFSKHLDKTIFTGPIIALCIGIIMCPQILNLVDIQIKSEGYQFLAELALALVLFTDASKTNLMFLRKSMAVPARLLLIGLPLTMLFGFIGGILIFKGFSWIEVGLLAVMLAPTDAALGKAVVTNPIVPERIRNTLNVESGLNDGICVPALFLLMAFFTTESVDTINVQYGLSLFGKEIGLGLIAGLGLTYVADRLMDVAFKKGYISESWKPILIIALAFGCFSLAQTIGGSGFIACFCGGILFGISGKPHKMELVEAAEGAGDTLSLVTWLIFGSVVIIAYLPFLSWKVCAYAILSLTIIRIIPVLISLVNTRFTLREKLFIGWFGPRGLATIVFAIMVVEIDLPNEPTIILTVVCTVLFSILAHGISANPLIRSFKIEQ